jgi:hypothetical protein
MSKSVQRLVLICLCIAAACVAAGQVADTADREKATEAAKKRSAQREALWEALEKALPEEYKSIDVYAENPSLSVVLFRSKRTTLRFSLRDGKVEEVGHMKALNRINCITYDERQRGFVMWLNGKAELFVGL